MGSFMRSQITERIAELQGHTSGTQVTRDDVLSLMIRANEAESAEKGSAKRATLDDEELVSDSRLIY